LTLKIDVIIKKNGFILDIYWKIGVSSYACAWFYFISLIR
jgi:hypothetical protein